AGGHQPARSTPEVPSRGPRRPPAYRRLDQRGARAPGLGAARRASRRPGEAVAVVSGDPGRSAIDVLGGSPPCGAVEARRCRATPDALAAERCGPGGRYGFQRRLASTRRSLIGTELRCRAADEQPDVAAGQDEVVVLPGPRTVVVGLQHAVSVDGRAAFESVEQLTRGSR